MTVQIGWDECKLSFDAGKVYSMHRMLEALEDAGCAVGCYDVYFSNSYWLYPSAELEAARSKCSSESLYLQSLGGSHRLVLSKRVSDFDETKLARITHEAGAELLPITEIDGVPLNKDLPFDVYVPGGDHIVTYWYTSFGANGIEAEIAKCELSFEGGDQYGHRRISEMLKIAGCELAVAPLVQGQGNGEIEDCELALVSLVAKLAEDARFNEVSRIESLPNPVSDYSPCAIPLGSTAEGVAITYWVERRSDNRRVYVYRAPTLSSRIGLYGPFFSADGR
jgi:hypothetical protein